VALIAGEVAVALAAANRDKPAAACSEMLFDFGSKLRVQEQRTNNLLLWCPASLGTKYGYL
jgi:hypothetical protein